MFCTSSFSRNLARYTCIYLSFLKLLMEHNLKEDLFLLLYLQMDCWILVTCSKKRQGQLLQQQRFLGYTLYKEVSLYPEIPTVTYMKSFRGYTGTLREIWKFSSCFERKTRGILFCWGHLFAISCARKIVLAWTYFIEISAECSLYQFRIIFNIFL